MFCSFHFRYVSLPGARRHFCKGVYAIMITVENLTFSYGSGKEVVSCRHACFEPGNIYLLTGPNGSGKTTFLRLLLGLLKPTSGSISGLREQTVAYVPDYNGLYDSLSVLENIKFRLALYNLDYAKERDRIFHILEQYRMDTEKDKLVRDLSLGMKKKAALICALAVRSSLLILDEPTGGLDADARKELSEMLLRCLSPETTILCTTHDQEFIDSLPGSVPIRFPMEG